MIDKIQIISQTMRKPHKSHAKHVFTYLEKHYNMTFKF